MLSILKKKKKEIKNGGEEGRIWCECGAKMAETAVNEGQELSCSNVCGMFFNGDEALG